MPATRNLVMPLLAFFPNEFLSECLVKEIAFGLSSCESDTHDLLH
jgi:hypothetical protein